MAAPLELEDLVEIVVQHAMQPPCTLETFCALRGTSRLICRVATAALTTSTTLPIAGLRRMFIDLAVCGCCGVRSNNLAQSTAHWHAFPYPIVLHCDACRLYALAALLRSNTAPHMPSVLWGVPSVLYIPLNWTNFDVEELHGMDLLIPRSDGSRSRARPSTQLLYLLTGGRRALEMLWPARCGEEMRKTVTLDALVECNPTFRECASKLAVLTCWHYSHLLCSAQDMQQKAP